MKDRRFYSLTEAARIVGINERQIRRAESERRLPAPQRDEARHRMYYSDDLARMKALLRRQP